MEKVATNSPKRKADGDNRTLYFKIGDKWRRWLSALKQEQWMRLATPSTLTIGDKCGGGGQPVSKQNTVHDGIDYYST